MAAAFILHDQQTGKEYELSEEYGTIRAMDLRAVKETPDDFGLMTYDPAFMNTACVKSKITYIDGDRGILQYRGYSIDEIAERSNYFLEVAYLLLYGELPSVTALASWQKKVREHSAIPDHILRLIESFPRNAHPMGILAAAISALAAVTPNAQDIQNPESRRQAIYQLLGQMPTIAAAIYRHSRALPFVPPDTTLSYAGNFLNCMFHESPAAVSPVLERAMTVLFILHADHEQNCSTNVMRSIGSSHASPFAALAGAIAALWGPLHGGANEEVLHMLDDIGTSDRIPEFIDRVKTGKDKLMGFGHRIYKNYDPRARVIKNLAYEVFEVTGRNSKLDLALALEQIALNDDYFIKRKLYPNVDFYSGLIYQAMGFPPEFFTVLFAIGRTAGWLAQWEEHMTDPEQKIARPRQIYLGHEKRPWVPIEDR
jgi:citrate synthase